MKVMVLVKATRDSEAGVMPTEQQLAEMGRYNEELVKAGIMQAGEGLHPTTHAKRIRFSGSQRTVVDGPFSPVTEQLAGFWLWQVQSLDEAVEWVKRCPNPMNEDSEIEIRQVFDAADFGEVLTPALREQEATLRAVTLGLGEVRFENGPARTLAGMNRTYDCTTVGQIPDHWDRFMSQVDTIAGRVGAVTYGLCWNGKPDGSFDYLTGVEVTDASRLAAEFTSTALPAQRYVIVTHRGPVAGLPKTLETIWKKWIPDAGLDTTGTCLERYDERFDPKTNSGDVEIWIPLRA